MDYIIKNKEYTPPIQEEYSYGNISKKQDEPESKFSDLLLQIMYKDEKEKIEEVEQTSEIKDVEQEIIKIEEQAQEREAKEKETEEDSEETIKPEIENQSEEKEAPKEEKKADIDKESGEHDKSEEPTIEHESSHDIPTDLDLPDLDYDTLQGFSTERGEKFLNKDDNLDEDPNKKKKPKRYYSGYLAPEDADIPNEDFQ